MYKRACNGQFLVFAGLVVYDKLRFIIEGMERVVINVGCIYGYFLWSFMVIRREKANSVLCLQSIKVPNTQEISKIH